LEDVPATRGAARRSSTWEFQHQVHALWPQNSSAFAHRHVRIYFCSSMIKLQRPRADGPRRSHFCANRFAERHFRASGTGQNPKPQNRLGRDTSRYWAVGVCARLARCGQRFQKSDTHWSWKILVPLVKKLSEGVQGVLPAPGSRITSSALERIGIRVQSRLNLCFSPNHPPRLIP